MFERKMVVFVAIVFVAMRGERKGGKRKKYFFNSSGIILRGNIICISYSDCYSSLQAWRVTVANLKKNLEIERL